jgi:signal transduction histidine kinase
MKQEFVSIIGHELRTPLTSLQAVLELMRLPEFATLSDTGERRLQIAERSVARLIRLIGELLDLDKSEAGKLEADAKMVPIDELVESAVEAVIDFANQRHLKITKQLSGLVVWAESDKIVQVLVNLLSNAIKFSPANSTIAVELLELPEFVEIKVIDQGVGIPSSHHAIIFERYKQVRLSDSSKAKGSGLGLAICKALINAHKGKIGVTSKENEGSTFWFRLPKVSEDEVDGMTAQT